MVFEPRSQTIIIADAAKSLFLLQLSEDGAIVGEWRAGPKTEAGFIASAVAVDDGKALVTMIDGRFFLADIPETIAKSSWVLQPLAEERNALLLADAMLPESGVIFGYSDTEIFTLNGTDGSVIDTYDRSGKQLLAVGRDFAPHVVLGDGGGFVTVITAADGGKLRASQIIGADVAPTATLYDRNRDLLLSEIPPRCLRDESVRSRYGYYSDERRCIEYSSGDEPLNLIYRVRLGDNLLLDKTALPIDGRYVLTPEYLVSQRDTVLGAMERRSYGEDGARLTIDGYNVDLLRKMSEHGKP